jgi:hypothetical protein
VSTADSPLRSTIDSQHRLRLLLAGAAVGMALILWNVGHPVLRLSSSLANHVVLAAALLVPWPLAVASWWLRPWPARVIGLIGGAALGLAFLLPAGITLLDMAAVLRQGHSEAFLLTSEVQLLGTRVRAYQTNGGATTDYGLVVRQERALVPGLLLVRNLFGQDHARGGRLEPVGNDQIQIYPRGDAVDAPGSTVRLRELVWF